MSQILDISNLNSPDAIAAVPESVARESCILPVRFAGQYLHVIIPVDADVSLTIDKLEFILNRKFTADTADRDAIANALE